ncbi:iron-uptake system-binding protein [Trichonephila clavipes]|nr:iron-uptake system-binding protein [Trichonephila clavipes]
MLASQHINHLKQLARSKSKAALLRNCTNSLIKALCECTINILKGNVPLTKHRKSRLPPYKKVLRKLASRKVPLYKKRKLLVQKGEGFLSFLIPAAVSVISSLLHGTD